MTSDREAMIIDAIANAEDIEAPVADGQPGQKPRLLIENCDPDRTVAGLRDIFSHAGRLYDRGVPCPPRFRQDSGRDRCPSNDARCPGPDVAYRLPPLRAEGEGRRGY